MSAKPKAKKKEKALDSSTEERIKHAARKLFTQKGYAATKTRDIAEESGINLALLNYYFRSKEKLFQLIMQESLQEFIQGIVQTFNDEKMSIDKKIELLADHYISMLMRYPDLPLFILSELRSHPEKSASQFTEKLGLARSSFIQQIQQAMKAGKIADVHIAHVMANLMGLMVFPFVGAPMLKKFSGVNDKQFMELMEERKKLIPVWFKAMMKSK